jgi:predicted transcriptional regulator
MPHIIGRNGYRIRPTYTQNTAISVTKSRVGYIILGEVYWMFFAVVKIIFEHEPGSPTPDRKELAAFLDKLRARFRVTALAHSNTQEDGETSIAYTSLAHSEESLTKQLDAIAAFCEEQGLGRVADESVLMDHIESIGESDDD